LKKLFLIKPMASSISDEVTGGGGGGVGGAAGLGNDGR
jgi:hypothetical protein